jgi:hypothetical protein
VLAAASLALSGTPVVLAGAPASAAVEYTASIDNVFAPAPGRLRLYGWAYDNDSQGPAIDLHIYVGGPGTAPGVSSYTLVANNPRPDAHRYPHGFDSTFDVTLSGPQPVYIYAINVPGSPGGNELLWADTVDIPNASPETAITSGPPASSTNTRVSFSFSSNEPGTFACRMDQGAWQACASPYATTVTPGDHTYSVQAVDAYGLPDPTPSTYSFTVTSPTPPPPPPVPPVVTPPPPAQPSISLALKPVRRKSRLRIDIGPDLEQSNYQLKIQRRAGKKWRTAKRTQTLGPRDRIVIDLRRGTYRVIVPPQHEMLGTRATARLRR